MEAKYYIMKYVLKICGTAIVLTPLFYLILLCVLPGYQISDLIGLTFIIYLLPYTLLFNIIAGLGLFVMILVFYSLISNRTIKIIISVLATAIIFISFKLLYVFDPNNIYIGDYLLATIISLTLIFFIWFYRLKPLYDGDGVRNEE